ncbi:MAG: nucleotidyltransferase domain-containing protein [Desulfamplus sp.]|nr:nucleotidyltransferase domain-containing protein [Desulfamplus sp.]
MNREEILEKIKQTIYEIEPDAEVVLYGSRARDDFSHDSDWDLLILVEGVLGKKRVNEIRHHLYQIEWDYGEVISSIVRTKEEWNSAIYQVMPFHKRVESEGIRV